MSTEHTPGPTAAYVFSIDASTGYQATTEGVCTPEQYGNALAALHGNRTTLEQELLAALQGLMPTLNRVMHLSSGTWDLDDDESVKAARDAIANAGGAV